MRPYAPALAIITALTLVTSCGSEDPDADQAPNGTIAAYAGGCLTTADCLDGVCLTVLGSKTCLPPCTAGSCPGDMVGECRPDEAGTAFGCVPTCGADAACPGGLVCANLGNTSVCGLADAPDHDSCAIGWTSCDGACVELGNDPAHCGQCDKPCPGGASCNAGQCACDDETATECGGQCVQTNTDPNNCGTCTTVCDFSNGTTTCITGKCALTGCQDGFLNCDGKDGNGCETAVESVPEPVITIEPGGSLEPLTALTASATNSTAPSGAVTAWAWTIEQPVESASSPEPSGLDTDTVTLQADVTGTYVFRLKVTDDSGTVSCKEAVQSVVTVPKPLAYFELTWSGTADLDLHLADASEAHTGADHDGDGEPDPWFQTPWDCYSQNPEPSWGEELVIKDDPKLLRADSDGDGPEALGLVLPQHKKQYHVGVHFVSEGGSDISEATLKVYLFGKLAYQGPAVALSEGDMWFVGTLDWETELFTPKKDGDGAPIITTDYPIP